MENISLKFVFQAAGEQGVQRLVGVGVFVQHSVYRMADGQGNAGLLPQLDKRPDGMAALGKLLKLLPQD